MTTENAKIESIVALTNDVATIEQQIHAIGLSSKGYKTAVSSALINAIQHHITNGGYELITNVIKQVAAANPRDLKVVSLFIDKVSPFVLKTEKDMSDDEKTAQRIGKSKIYVPIVIGRIKATAKAGDASDSSKKDTQDKNAVKRFKQFAGTLTNNAGEDQPRGYNLGKDHGGIFDYACDVFAWADYQEFQKVSGGNGGNEKSDEQKRVDIVDREVNKVNDMLKLAWLEGNEDVKAAGEAFITAIMKSVESDRASLTKAAQAKQLTKQVEKLDKSDFKGRVNDWKAEHAKLVAAGKTSENIDTAFTNWFDGMVKKAAEDKAAKEKAESEKPEVITSETK